MPRQPLDELGTVVATIRLPATLVRDLDDAAERIGRNTGVPATRSAVVRLILNPDEGRSFLETHAGRLAAAVGANTVTEAIRAEPTATPAGVNPGRRFVVDTTTPSADDVKRLAARILAAIHRDPRKSTKLCALTKHVGRPRHPALVAALLSLEKSGDVALLPPRPGEKLKPHEREAAIHDEARGELVRVRRVRWPPRR